jgi:DICT domain-containing protein
VQEALMKNITLAIEDEVLDKVRIVAAEKKTTVNALVREFLADLASRDERLAEARKQLLRLMDTSEGRMAPDWKFDREETHER